MRIDIHDMFDGYIDESGITFDTDKENISMEKIKEMTMDKVSGEQKRRLGKTAKILIAVAAVAVLLTGAVSAAVMVASFRANLGETDYTFVNSDDEEDVGTYDVGLEITLPAHEDLSDNEIGFTLGYVPELSGKYECSDYTLPGSGTIYHQYVHSGVDTDEAISIMLCRPSDTDKTYIIMGTTEVVREDIVNGHQAKFITVDKGEDSDNFLYPRTNAIVLTDEVTGAAVVINSTFGFDELERVAQDIEFKESSAPAYHEDGTFGGVVGEFSMG